MHMKHHLTLTAIKKKKKSLHTIISRASSKYEVNQCQPTFILLECGYGTMAMNSSKSGSQSTATIQP